MGVVFVLKLLKSTFLTLKMRLFSAFLTLCSAKEQLSIVNEVMKELATPSQPLKEQAGDEVKLGARSGGVNHTPRRSKDLKAMAKSLLTHVDLDSSSFETFWSQLWSYGCHCFDADTDRPLSAMHHGEPVDKLDSACRNYKRCQACAAEEYGPDCIGELVDYEYIPIEDPNRELVPRHIHLASQSNSCAHKIFECDHRFALEMLEYHEINLNYTRVDSNSGWDRAESCHAKRHHGAKPKYKHECCHVGTFFTWYNANTRKCCVGKGTKKIDENCE